VARGHRDTKEIAAKIYPASGAAGAFHDLGQKNHISALTTKNGARRPLRDTGNATDATRAP
jgi:hypothetical protein